MISITHDCKEYRHFQLGLRVNCELAGFEFGQICGFYHYGDDRDYLRIKVVPLGHVAQPIWSRCYDTSPENIELMCPHTAHAGTATSGDSWYANILEGITPWRRPVPAIGTGIILRNGGAVLPVLGHSINNKPGELTLRVKNTSTDLVSLFPYVHISEDEFFTSLEEYNAETSKNA